MACVPECRHAELFRILSFHFKYRNGINNTAQLTEGHIFRQKGLVPVHALVCVCAHLYVHVPKYRRRTVLESWMSFFNKFARQENLAK